MKKVIIIGKNNYNTLGVIRSLGEKKIKSNLYLITARSISGRMRYCSKSRYVKSASFYPALNDNLFKDLLETKNTEGTKPVIIPTSDDAMIFLISKEKELSEKYILPQLGERLKENSNYLDKYLISQIAEKAGLIVPKSLIYYKGDKDIINKASEITLPLIIKPVGSNEGPSNDIRIVDTLDQLSLELNSTFKNYQRVLIQEYISGHDSFMVELKGCVLLDSGEVILPGIIEKIREYPLNKGSTSFANLKALPEYVDVEAIEDFLSKTGFKGIFDLEFIFSKGKLYFIEMNFRNGAPGYAYTKNIINLPFIWTQETYKDSLKIEKSSFKRENNFLMMELTDFYHVINGDVKLINWLTDFLRTKTFLLLNLRDPRPFIFMIYEAINFKIKKAIFNR